MLIAAVANIEINVCLCLTFFLTTTPQDWCSGTGQRSDIRVTSVDGNI